MIIDYNSSEQVRSELIKILMNYLKEITDTEYPVGDRKRLHTGGGDNGRKSH